jgi:hypothetical protein
MYGALSDMGYEATLLVYALKIHEYSSIYDSMPQLFRFFGAHRRAPNPAVVTWTRPMGEDRPELGLVYDGAYWVSGVAAGDPKSTAIVTVTSDGIRHSSADPATAVRTSEVVFDSNAPSKRSLGELYRTTPTLQPPLPRANVLHLDARNAKAVTVDLVRARLTLGKPLRIETTSDAPLTLTLRGPKGAVRTVDVPAGKRAQQLRGRRG